MITTITGSALTRQLRREPRATSLRPRRARRAAKLTGVLPRTARRLFDRVGTGLQRFDDNLWDGGDGT